MIILFTSNNIASKKIAENLILKHGFQKLGDREWQKEEVKLIDTDLPTVLDVPPAIDTDCIIMLSTHKSKVPGKMLTAHIPGNWSDAGLGGEPETLNIAATARLKKIAIAMKNEAEKIGWPFCLEADHHGPTIAVPIIFVEIGNDEEQWKDEKAAEAVANAVSSSLGPLEEYRTVVGFGGGHYQKKFTELIGRTDMAIGHMAPKYVIDGLDEKMFKQALDRNIEPVHEVVVLKDETNTMHKKKIKELADKFAVRYTEI
ncbi:D-aminoacyl-tRNA deacylase [Candidatus Bilamarchaeum dharawalense]|uniref:D-tyrosyl-tRNA(Tyr) deacylase n=1 Tax=Candidatus Bilamarchaeum dharawalense TaxID=2885759 RepID=A0A5E4LQS7_9ARCH|nr:D-aminoacyl-tRNA deacylase [Candidatus Bilamarchaeum dharawalense]